MWKRIVGPPSLWLDLPLYPPPSLLLPASRAGHYVSLIKSHNNWLFFDDDSVDGISESQIQSTFGSTQEYNSSNTDHG
jgi:hypothetical protein